MIETIGAFFMNLFEGFYLVDVFRPEYPAIQCEI